MEKAADLSFRTFAYLQTILKPAMDPLELGTLLETFGRQHGHSGKLRIRDYQNEAHPWRIRSARKAIHDRQLPSHEPVLIELATILNGYHCFESRMILCGDLPAKVQAANQAILQIQNLVLEKLKPGMSVRAVYQTAWAEAERLGYQNVFMGLPENKNNFMGHGIGAELIESPLLSADATQFLRPGMTFTLEPKIVLEAESIIGLADVFQVTQTGVSLLTKTLDTLIVY
jgi:Xaa-Pro aminopeptidase